jgi:hypothetical protein
MMSVKTVFAAIGIAALLPATAFAGGTLSRADFERCNQQAMQVAGIASADSPSASPSTPGSGTSGSTSGAGSSQSPSASPSASGTTGATGAGSSTSGSTTTGSTMSGSGTQSGAGSTAAADQQKLDKAVQAYRDCLQQ